MVQLLLLNTWRKLDEKTNTRCQGDQSNSNILQTKHVPVLLLQAKNSSFSSLPSGINETQQLSKNFFVLEFERIEKRRALIQCQLTKWADCIEKFLKISAFHSSAFLMDKKRRANRRVSNNVYGPFRLRISAEKGSSNCLRVSRKSNKNIARNSQCVRFFFSFMQTVLNVSFWHIENGFCQFRWSRLHIYLK